MTSLNIIEDENGKKIADWYIADPPKGFIVDFMTLEPTKCKAILNIILKELVAESKSMARKQIYIGDMSHETAIGILKLMLEAMEIYDGISPTPERINAVKMGIEELKQGSILDKIRAEIEQEYNRLRATRADETLELGECLGLKMSLKIIDKYKSGSEEV
jgi:hypothetical protein